MQTTYDPEIIYGVFERRGFSVLRIDNFDRGNYAELRAELNYNESLSVAELNEVAMKLSIVEREENISIKIVHLDMIHRTIRMNIHIGIDKKEVTGSTPV
ncbi:MAG: hypothetical protein GY765_11000 [bacterium]|nr:hypothetical protein [bacterium]